MVSSIMFTDYSSLIPLNRCNNTSLLPRCVVGQFRLRTTSGCSLSVRSSSSSIPAISGSLSSSYVDLARHNSVFLKNLSPTVGKCVEVLRDFQKQNDELEARYLEERAALEAIYQKPLHTKIMNGVVEVEGAPEEVKSAEEKGVLVNQSLIYSMTRTKRGNIARRRRTKLRLFALGFRGAHSRLTRIMIQQRIRALVSAHRDRGRRKRDFRRLWITRINAVIQEMKVFYSYNRFIHNLYKKQLLLNRKILAQIALLNRSCLYTISNDIKK